MMNVIFKNNNYMNWFGKCGMRMNFSQGLQMGGNVFMSEVVLCDEM